VAVVLVIGGGATVKGAVRAAGGGAVTSGCVFFISTAGEVGRIAMRAVSFFGPGDVGKLVGAEAGDLGMGGGATALAGGIGAGREKGGGGTGFAGAGGKGVCASGGRSGAPGGGGGGGGVSFDGGRAGKFIRTVSRSPVLVAGGWLAEPGGKVMRTVSFLGSIGSAIRRREYL
jgi:hypothetical protein